MTGSKPRRRRPLRWGALFLPRTTNPYFLNRVCCKILEHILCCHIHKYLDKHSILISLQPGFRSRHSCELPLIMTIHDLMLRYEKKKPIDIAILDASTASDTILHERLLTKLMHNGINGQIRCWIAAFLRNHTQCIDVDGEISSSNRV